MPDVIARGIRFHVIRMGHGEPILVMVHGLIVDSHASFYISVAPGLAKHATVILYDLRGHGRSEQPPSGYTADDMVADLAGVLDSLDLHERQVILVGNSFGGHIALRFAVTHPERVRALVLVDAQSGVAVFGEDMVNVLAVDEADRDRKGDEIVGRWLALQSTRLTATFENVRQMQWRRPRRGAATADGLMKATTLVADLLHTPAIADDAIAGLRCPVLAIYGENSDLREDAERLGRLLPTMELQFVPAMGHTILLEAAAQVRDAILAWLPRVSP